MNSNVIFRNIGRFVLLMLLQLTVFNNIYLGGYINPCIYLLFVAMLPTNTGRLAMLLISFGSGLFIDLFSNMPGFHTAACTLVGFLRVMWADKILLRDNDDTIETPSIYSVSYQQFSIYLLLLLIAYYLLYYMLVDFSLRGLPATLLSTLFSSLVTFLLALLYQSIFLRKTKKD